MRTSLFDTLGKRGNVRVGRTKGIGRARVSGFTLVDVIVSIAVIAVLIGLLMPALSTAQEAARRIVCRSNVRQVGIGIALYAEANKDYLPPSRFAGGSDEDLQNMTTLRYQMGSTYSGVYWDGLGHLYDDDLLPAPMLFYCPSHRGNFPFKEYAAAWQSDEGKVVCNYHYRGTGADGVTVLLSRIEPANSALVADGMQSQQDFNHVAGANVLRADMSAGWYDDSDGSLFALLSDGGGGAPGKLKKAWGALDRR